MKCKSCDGEVLVDTFFATKDMFELVCLMCGRRWFIEADSGFGKWLKENLRSKG